MSNLTAIFGSSAEKSQDSEKLMDLYWNRAELKKEFAGMRKEQFRLEDKIKRQEGATARLQQKLDYLEDLLIDPQQAHNVVVYFQFRGMAMQSERKLAKFAEQLKQQREQKEHDSFLGDWNDKLLEEASQVKLQILEKRDQVQQLEDQLQAERQRLTAMSAFVRFFRGRSLTKLLDDLATQIETAQQEEQTLKEDVKIIKNRQPPGSQGLDIATKRSINLMILAFAQHLYVHFANDDLVDLIKEAGEKSVGAIAYGSKYECEQLLTRMQKCNEKFEQNTDFADTLQKRALLLGERAKFHQNTDAVPDSESVRALFRIGDDGLIRESDVNMLGDNYWGISKVLSR
ncbi:MAG: hypothetical protein DRR11_03370 [Gammaproteobacteria bacterium]|nr:MAG: hypothetical protein DRR15_10200 [Gammaproteobacteria bacterium]RLA34235.1 MAG: hypothetical protein DRR11_03370 [Gammaproteobacteria bacterium]